MTEDQNIPDQTAGPVPIPSVSPSVGMEPASPEAAHHAPMGPSHIPLKLMAAGTGPLLEPSPKAPEGMNTLGTLGTGPLGELPERGPKPRGTKPLENVRHHRAAYMAPRALAFLGDAVFELHVRMQILATEDKGLDLHRASVQRVKAQAQANLARAVKEHLRSDEADVFQRARNAKVPLPQKQNPADYRLATAWEAVLGYLHLSGQEERLAELLALGDRLGPHVKPGTEA